MSIRAAETACLAAMQPNSCVCSVNRITWLLSRLQYSSTKTQAMLVQPVQEFDPSQDPAEGHAIADAGDRAQDGQEGSKEDERSTLDILQYSKDVAAAVDRSRVLAKSLHRTVEDVISSPALSLTIIKEHRELVRKAEMWRVLTSDSSLQFFVSDKAGAAAGLVPLGGSIGVLYESWRLWMWRTLVWYGQRPCTYLSAASTTLYLS